MVLTMASVPQPPPNSVSESPAIPPDILLFVGPILIGNLVGWFLLGVLTMQLYVYYICFPKDRWWIKLSAYGLYFLDVLQSIFVTDIAWTALCSQWGNPAALMHTTWAFSMNPIVIGIVACWVQTFFAWRVWAVGRSFLWKAVTAVIVAVALTQAGAAFALTIIFMQINDLSKIYRVNKVVPVWLAGSAVADCLIAASMTYFLASPSRKHMWSKLTNKRITNLVRSIVETGVLSSAAAFIDLGFFLATPHYNVHISIAMVLSKLYSNALMASLNSRTGVYERLPAPRSRGEDTEGYFNTVQFTSVGIPVAADDIVSNSRTAVSAQDAKPAQHARPYKLEGEK